MSEASLGLLAAPGVSQGSGPGSSTGGVEVHLQQTTRFKTVHLHWLVEAPLDQGRTARALLPDLITRGTASYPELSALSARCEELYNTELLAAVTAHGSRQLLRFGVETIADRHSFDGPLFSRVTALLEEVLHRPPLVDERFRKEHVLQEQTNLARAIESLADDKPLHTYRRLMETMHEGTHYARHSWGSAEEARALTEADIHEAWDHVRTQAPVRLMIVGDVSPEQAFETAARLSGVETRSAPGEPVPIPDPPERPVREVEEAQPLAQSRLAMGFRLPPKRLSGAACKLASLVLGGGSHSRLFKRVREAESLAYGCGSSAVLDSGTLVVQAGVDHENVDRVRELVCEELETLARDGVSEEEFSLSVRAQKRRLRALADSPAATMGFRLTGLMSGRATSAEEALEQLFAVTPEDVAAVAAECVLDSVFVLRGTLS